MWRELFRLAGLDFGRAKGLVWHTTRHEFVSRHAENTGDPVLTQHLARHKDLRTTQAYFHVRNSQMLRAGTFGSVGRTLCSQPHADAKWRNDEMWWKTER